MKRHLYYETSHSPALVDLVGHEQALSITDFCFIANPYYPTDSMIEEMQEHLSMLIKSYPSSNPKLSQKNVASVLKVREENVLIGNGATELITRINEDLIDQIAIPVPTFGEYIEKLKDKNQAKLYYLQPDESYQLDLTNYLDWIDDNQFKSALIINPGNPTGQLHSLKEMTKFLNKAKHLELVIVDESFIDFAHENPPSLLSIAEQYPNVLIVRSMSKHCGIPGLRLGYCYSGNMELINQLRRFIPTWNLNTMAEYFLTLLATTDSIYHETRIRLIQDVSQLYTGLTTIPGIMAYKTGANFVLAKILNGMTAAQLQEILLNDYKMYVRDCSNKVGMDQFHIRIASQGRDKDSQLINSLKKIMTT